MRPRLFLLLLPWHCFAAKLCYDVKIVGLEDPAALASMRDASQLMSLQQRPPASINGLRYRASSDIPALLTALRAHAYYDADIRTEIVENGNSLRVYLFIEPGPQYALSSYEIFHGACQEKLLLPENFCLAEIGVDLGKPALSVEVVNAELSLLTALARRGLPLAYIDKRRVEVDLREKTVSAAACVQEGPVSNFGPTSVFGLEGVEPRYIARKISWKEGELYTSDKIDATQARLLSSNLFSSVLISHAEGLDEQGELAMKIRVEESKHRTLSLGAYYATVDGPGVSASWTNRNVRGMGETVNLDGQFSLRFIGGSISYRKPDFLRFNQSYRALANLGREKIHPYTAVSYRLANYIERKINEEQTFSIGLKIDHANISKSATNGTYLLLGLPIFAKMTTADSVLDPTRGFTIVYQGTPYQSLFHGKQQFIKQRLTFSFYVPLTPANRFIVALRTQFGSIAGTAQPNVPLTKLFLGGTEDDLRGYRYKSVSPLNAGGQSLGGRSAVFATAEIRWRLTKKIGIVPFADFGTVTFQEWPQFNVKWFKSVGIGLRYFAFFGPLRFDIGFPLDRRPAIDPKFRIYASMGQTF